MNAVSAAASAIKATYRKASLVAYPTTNSNSQMAKSIQAQRRPTVSAEHRDQLFDLIAVAQNPRMDEQRASLPALTLTNGVNLRNPTSANLLSRGQTVDNSSSNSAAAKVAAATSAATPAAASTSSASRSSFAKPDTIYEDHARRNKQERSQSIAPGHLNFRSTTTSTTSGSAGGADNKNSKTVPNQQQSITKPKLQMLSRHFQTVDAPDAPHQVHDEKFLDSLMKYQSNRFNDQRSELPTNRNRDNVINKCEQSEREKGQVDNFFNSIVKFQSGRYDDQRSAPPTKSKNI